MLMLMVSVMAVMRRCFIGNHDPKQSILPRLTTNHSFVLHEPLEIPRESVLGCNRNEIHVLDVSSLMWHHSIASLLIKVLEQLLELGFALLK